MKSSDFRGGLKPNIEDSRSFIKHKNLTNFISETIQPMMLHEGKAKVGTSKAVEKYGHYNYRQDVYKKHTGAAGVQTDSMNTNGW